MPRWAVAGLSLLAGVVAIFVLGFVVFGTGEEVAVGLEATSAEATTADEAEAEAEHELRVTVRDGEPVGGIQRLAVTVGEEVKVRVESDVADEVHVHGYDLTADVAAGGEAELELEATIPGIFELELERSGIPIAELEVRP